MAAIDSFWIILVLTCVLKHAEAIFCYQCNSTQLIDQFQCGEFFDESSDVLPTSCHNVYGAKYCIKQLGHIEGGVGTRRFCSSSDLGSYCNYVKQPGDILKDYRSCFFTCDTDGCNGGAAIAPTLATLASLLTIYYITS